MQFSFAQEKTVTGTVRDASGTLPGANVIVEGTVRSTQTDIDGKYAISASAGEVIVISFVGMADFRATVGASNVINATLAEGGLQLGEVVVIGALGVRRQEKAVTYAAQSVAGEDLTEARETNLVNALSGKIAGVQVTNSSGSVGSSSRIVLRGNSTITGNNQALFVIDGVPFDNSNYGNAGDGGGRDLPNGAATINPDDIESISVLKGPTAAALYGIRASKGVILITTKSGRQGKVDISYNSNITFSNPLRLPRFQNSYGQGSTADYFEYVDGAGGGYNDGVDESWGPALDRGLEFVQWDSYKNGGLPTPWVSSPNNVKDFYETGVSMSNSLSLSGGTETSSFRLSLGNTDETGMVPFTDFRKFNVGFNGSMKMGPKVTAGLSVNYFNNTSDNLPTMGYSSQNPAQQFLWSARQVNFSDLKDWRNLPLAPVGTAAEGTPLNWNNIFQNNPYWVLENNRNTFDQDRVTGSTFINYKFNTNLSVNGKLSLDEYSQRETLRSEMGTNERLTGYYAEIQRRYSEINAEAILTYQKDLSDDFSFSINGGLNSMKRVRTTMIGELTGGLELPGLFTLSNVKSGTTPIIDSDYFEQRINSAFVFGQLSYKNFAFVDFSGRNDWSTLLADENNSFFYPAVSGSLVISDMLDFSNDSTVSYLKLRGGWSKVGGVGPLNEYSLNRTFTLTNNNFGTVSSIPNTAWNPNIRPESTEGTEIGLDINAFNSRVRLGATYYNQRSYDLILPLQVEAASGFTSSWENGGEMLNKGIELQLGITAVKSEDFRFDIDLNFAKNENEVISLGGADAYTLGGQWGMELQARPGEAYGSIVGFPYSRTESGEIIYVNGLPQVNNEELVVLGNITPDWTGGANFSVGYKGFDLSALVDAKIGGELFSMTSMWGRYAGVLEETMIGRETGVVGDGVMSDGNGGYVANNVVRDAKTFNQHAYNYSNFTESGIFDASYVKLRQVVLGYSFPKQWLQGTFIQDFKVSVVGRNLALLYSKVPHVDPETGFSSANGEQGQEFGQLPSATSYGFNVNVKF